MSIESADNILHVKNSTMRISRVEVGQTFSVGNIEFDTTTTLASVTSNGNNTTPHTISSSNVTTGLATTANVVVGGELTVSGNTTVTSNLEIGTANLFVDTTTSNVGIGTNLPLAALDVRGDIHATGSLNPVAGMWKQTSNNATISTTIIKNIGSCMTTKAAVGYGAGSGISGTAGAFVAPYDGVYQFQFFVLGESTSSNLLLIFKASGPTVSNGTWNDKNLLPTYQEVVDLRGVSNEEEPHGLSTLLNMSKDDTVEVDVHSTGLLGNGASTGGGYVRCSCFLVHRELN